jgi:hypothetical protein
MNEKNDKNKQSPGAGSDKQHPETPPDANERARKDQAKDKTKKIDEEPGSQMTG